MPLLLGFGWTHSQQLHSARCRAGLCLDCTELRTHHRGAASKQGWHRAKLTHSGSFCLASLRMEQSRMGISAFKLWFLSQQKAFMPWISACSQATLLARQCQWYKRGDCVSRDPMGRSNACLNRGWQRGMSTHWIWQLKRLIAKRHTQSYDNFLGRQWKPQPWSTGHILPDFSVSIHKYGSVKLFLKKVSILKPDEQHDFQKQLGSLNWNFPRKLNQVFKVRLSCKLLNMRS